MYRMCRFQWVRFPFEVNRLTLDVSVNCCKNETKATKVCAPSAHTHTLNGLKNKRKPKKNQRKKCANENYHHCTNFVRFGSAIYWPFHQLNVFNWTKKCASLSKINGRIREIVSHHFVFSIDNSAAIAIGIINYKSWIRRIHHKVLITSKTSGNDGAVAHICRFGFLFFCGVQILIQINWFPTDYKTIRQN